MRKVCWLLGANSAESAQSLSLLAFTLAQKSEIEEVSSVYQKALSINIKALGENHPTTELIRERIASL